MEVETDRPSWLCRKVANPVGYPGLLALVASGVAVWLAVRPEGPYDPRLAVLTATLVAVIWYAYFTFRVVRPPARIGLKLNPGLHGMPNSFFLYPEVDNLSDRQIYAHLTVRIWIDGIPVGLEKVFRGEEWLNIEAGRTKGRRIPLAEHLDWAVTGGPARPEILKSKQLLAAIEADWIDSLCYLDKHAMLFWKVDLQRSQHEPVEDREQIEQLFEPLPDPYGDQPD